MEQKESKEDANSVYLCVQVKRVEVETLLLVIGNDSQPDHDPPSVQGNLREKIQELQDHKPGENTQQEHLLTLNLSQKEVVELHLAIISYRFLLLLGRAPGVVASLTLEETQRQVDDFFHRFMEKVKLTW